MLFEDSDFPANNSALYYKGSTGHVEQIEWKRPQDLVEDPVLFPDDSALCVEDVVQGRLGDCWFLCACAAVAPLKQLIQTVLPVDQKTWSDQEYDGKFQFLFWRLGKWTEVTIDDRLPSRDGRLVFSRCSNKRFFWLPLLEKAYAKFHGCYEAIVAGQVCDALVDLTGGIAVKVPLRTAPEQLADRLHKAHVRGMLLTCSTNRSEVLPVSESSQHDEGMCEPHAFNITTVQQGTGEIHARADVWLGLHNPWGEGTAIYRILFEDFCQHFHEVTIAGPVPDLLFFDYAGCSHGNNLQWHVEKRKGCWEVGVSAGGCRNNWETYPTNPQYLLTIQAPSEEFSCGEPECFVLLALMQETNRLQPDWKNQEKAIGMHVWQACTGDTPARLNAPDFIKNDPVAITTPPHAHAREVTLTCQLKPGAYVIIPSTFQPDIGKDFLLRVFSSWPFELRVLPLTYPGIQSTAGFFTRSLLGCPHDKVCRGSPSSLATDRPPAESRNLPGLAGLDYRSDSSSALDSRVPLAAPCNGHTPGQSCPPGNTWTFCGGWEAGVNAGGCRNYKHTFHTNPQYFFCVPTGSKHGRTVTITLRQEKQGDLPFTCHAAAFHVYRVETCDRISDRKFFKKGDVGNCVPHQYLTSIHKKMVLPAGCYVVVPSTHQPNCEGRFVLSVALD